MPVAAENTPSFGALFSYRVCAVSFNKGLQQRRPALALRAPSGLRR